MHILFDIDNTLIDHYHSSKQAITKLLLEENIKLKENQSRTLVDLWFQNSSFFYDQYLSGNISYQEQGYKRITRLVKEIGVSVSENRKFDMYKNYVKLYHNNITTFPDTKKVIEALSKHYLLSILSNGDRVTQEKKLRTAKISHCFKYKIFSSDYKFQKPDERIFFKALEITNRKKNQIVYIGDDYNNDIDPCIKLRIPCCWINRHPVKTYSNVSKFNNLIELYHFLKRFN